MAKQTTHYRATFANGAVYERKASTKHFEFAWRWTDGRSGNVGFAATRELAERAVTSEAKRYGDNATTEIVPVEVVSRREKKA